MAHLPVQEIVWNHLAVIIRCGPGHDPRFAILKVKCNTRLCSLRTQDFPTPLHCTTQQNPPSSSPPSHINPYMHSHTAAYAQAHTHSLSPHTHYSMHTPRVDWPWWHPWYRSQWWAALSRQTRPGPPHTAQPTFLTAPAALSVWTPLSEPAHTHIYDFHRNMNWFLTIVHAVTSPRTQVLVHHLPLPVPNLKPKPITDTHLYPHPSPMHTQRSFTEGCQVLV